MGKMGGEQSGGLSGAAARTGECKEKQRKSSM